jgi:hypothetical protein
MSPMMRASFADTRQRMIANRRYLSGALVA